VPQIGPLDYPSTYHPIHYSLIIQYFRQYLIVAIESAIKYTENKIQTWQSSCWRPGHRSVMLEYTEYITDNGQNPA
jgi:hypothetical protein